MAQPLIKFYRSADAPTSAPIGSLWFSTKDSTIKVRKAVTDENPITDWESYGGDSIEIAATDSTNRNFLELEGNALAVREMATSVTKTTKAITVEGGPLANDITETGEEWPFQTVNGNRTIPAGTDIQTILEKLFLKELDGSATWGSATWATTPSYAAPSVALSSNGPVEYGTSLTINTLSAGKTTKGNRRVVCECTQGYFDENSDTWHSGNKTMEATPTISGTQSLTATWNGETVTNPQVSTSLKANKLGENKLKVTQSGETATHTAFKNCTVYPSTNTKKKLSNNPATFTGDTNASVTLSSSNDDTVNAYYKYYYFTTTALPTSLTIPSDAKSAFLTGYKNDETTKTTAGTVFFNVGATINAYILMPEGYELTQILYSDGSVCDGFTLRKNKYTYSLPDNSKLSYNIYCWENKGAGTADLRDMIITKKTSNN